MPPRAMSVLEQHPQIAVWDANFMTLIQACLPVPCLSLNTSSCMTPGIAWKVLVRHLMSTALLKETLKAIRNIGQMSI